MENNTRPVFRVPALWLTVDRPDGTVDYFLLNQDGNLVLTNGEVLPHHTEKPRQFNRYKTIENVFVDNSAVSLTI